MISLGKGEKYRFLLVMYGFCSNNALYSAGPSIIMFIFLLLTPRLLTFRIKSQPGVANEIFFY